LFGNEITISLEQAKIADGIRADVSAKTLRSTWRLKVDKP